MKVHHLIFTLVVTAACSPDSDPAPSTVVASVGPSKITLGDFARGVKLLHQNAARDKSAPVHPDAYVELLGRMIDLELLSKEAERRGAATLPVAQRRMREAMVDAYLADALRRLTTQQRFGKAALRQVRQDAVRLLVERLQSDATLDDVRFVTFGTALPDRDRELIAKEAERLGFHERYATLVARKQILASMVLRAEAESGKLRPRRVTEADVREAYDAATERFHRPARMHVWVARLDDAPSAAELAHEVAAISVTDAAGHRDLLADYRTAPGLIADLEDGDGRVPRAVRRALNDVDRAGAVLGPLAADGAFFVARRLARSEAVDVTFEEAKAELTTELQRRAWSDSSHERARAFETRWPVLKNTKAIEQFAAMQRRTIREI